MKKNKTTPLMKQYFEIKEQYPDTILLFQVGDFYELFFEDAKTASKFLAIALTKRGKNNGKDIPLCGIPVHALEHYLVKLIKGGFRVAICDQLTKPQPGLVVKRGVTQVFTPGTLTQSSMLDEKSASYIVSFFPKKEKWGLIFTELLTAQLFATTLPAKADTVLESELARFFPDEIILPQTSETKNFDTFFKQRGYVTSHSSFNPNTYQEKNDSLLWIEKQFNSNILNQLHQRQTIMNCLQSLYFYLKKNQEKALEQFKNIAFYDPDDYLILDTSTIKNLEITKNNQNGSRNNTLLEILDKSKTAMGSRTIKKWLSRPLVQKDKILQRSEVVYNLTKQIETMQKLEEVLYSISDLERITGRIALGRANQHDYLSLKNSLSQTPALKAILRNNLKTNLADIIENKISNFSSLVCLLESSLNEDTSSKWIIKKGFDLQLDRLRNLVKNSQQEILSLEQREIEKTSIGSLKIRFNNISGYYIEVTNPNLKLVPDNYIEQQKLVNRKRFITKELKQLESEILKAQNEIDFVQTEVFEKIKKEVENYLAELRQTAQAIAYLDALFGFAKVSYENNYSVPQFNDESKIFIEQGRHPVVEQKMDCNFQTNNTFLSSKKPLWIITGPNMGGKSTYLRQVALNCIIAQCGCMIPAKTANIPIIDRIFTRIGSGDNLAEGKSTFLVEMEETATICNFATKNSLVILDEVGRGTSTFDGIALAQSIIEHIYNNVKAKCLFATHYHELTKLSEKLDGISNYHMLSEKNGSNLIFLHKIAPGVANGSFGIEVAKLAKLPKNIISRAEKILIDIQKQGINGNNKDLGKNSEVKNLLKKIEVLEKGLEREKNISELFNRVDPNKISPKDAFDIIWNIKSNLKNKEF